MTVLVKIRELMEERHWSIQDLSKYAGIPRSTLTNMFRRETMPSLPTLEAIALAFGISPMQLFGSENEMVELTSEQRAFFEKWRALTAEQKRLVGELVENLNQTKP